MVEILKITLLLPGKNYEIYEMRLTTVILLYILHNNKSFFLFFLIMISYVGYAVTDLQSRVEVPVQPLHNEQHSSAGTVRVGVVDHRAVQVYQPLVFGQSPAGGDSRTGRIRGGCATETTLTRNHIPLVYCRVRR